MKTIQKISDENKGLLIRIRHPLEPVAQLQRNRRKERSFLRNISHLFANASAPSHPLRCAVAFRLSSQNFRWRSPLHPLSKKTSLTTHPTASVPPSGSHLVETLCERRRRGRTRDMTDWTPGRLRNYSRTTRCLSVRWRCRYSYAGVPFLAPCPFGYAPSGNTRCPCGNSH